MPDVPKDYEPTTLWIAVYAWISCCGVWLLGTMFDGWWVVLPSILIVSSSFALAVGKDLKDMKL